jgi:hypothetical protein
MKRSSLPVFAAALALCVGLPAAIPQSAFAQPTSNKGEKPLPASVAVAKLPPDAKEVSEIASSAKVGDPVVIRGRIAMVKNAFASDNAAFTLSDDAAVAECCPKDGTLMENCGIKPPQQVRIEVVDRGGKPLKSSLAGFGGLQPGAEVFVVGKVAAVGESPLVQATGLHIPRSSLPAGFFLAELPEGAKDLSEAKKAGGMKKGDRVALRGVIGGSHDPFVPECAMFTLMGSALKPCNANPDDKCAAPWDYCCETKGDIAANSATIRVADTKGNPLRTDIKGRAGIKELTEVIVLGTVAVAEKNTLIVDANGIHVVGGDDRRTEGGEPALKTVAYTDAKLEVGCGMCMYKMPGVDECDLAVVIEGKPYLVTGKRWPNHDYCDRKIAGVVSGELKGDKFIASSLSEAK